MRSSCSRRLQLPDLLIALACIGLGFLGIQQVAWGAAPNVLMICIDDLNDWVGFMKGHPSVTTPNLDALAARGRVFLNAHCVVPVCSASRVSVLSGIHATTHGSYELGPAYQNIPKLSGVPTIHEALRRQGYRTLTGGKVLHHGFTGVLESHVDEELGGKRGGGPRPPKPINWPGAWDWGRFPETDGEMYDFQLAEKAADRLRAGLPAPFFMSVGFFRPHVPMHVPPRWFELYAGDRAHPPMVPEGEMEDIPPNFQHLQQIAPTPEEIQRENKWEDLVRAYCASVSFVDHCVGRLLRGLDEGPHREDTFVVLWSDHGFHLGEKRHLAKRTLWEESTRVPFVVAGPGITPGEACQEPVSLLDVYPTILEICGLPRLTHLEGTSVTPQLKDPSVRREHPALISSYEGNHALRSRDWRYIRYTDGAEELYHHPSDPGEHVNLVGRPGSLPIIQELSKWLPRAAAAEIKPPNQREQRPRPRKDGR